MPEVETHSFVKFGPFGRLRPLSRFTWMTDVIDFIESVLIDFIFFKKVIMFSVYTTVAF
jgi:hypothetical protein